MPVTPPPKPSLLLVDDDDEIRAQMKWALTDTYDIVQASDQESAVAAFTDRRPLVVLLDLGLPPSPNTPEEGLATLGRILEIDPRCKVIVVTGQTDRDTALRAVGQGAYDFLCKPVDMDPLRFLLTRAFHIAQLERDHQALRQQFQEDSFEGMLGASPRVQKVFEALRKVATTDAPVLVLGESGTGKEMVARAVHRRSARRDGPFIAINCGAIPENLLESELFGHEKGAFTGAHVQRKGRVEMASGGTLFLDEVGELPQPLQVKLLRFLQEQCIERVGGRGEIAVDVRVVAATNANLKAAINTGGFREDLYYRLAVVELTLPPLRDRDDDVRLVAQSFLNRYAAESGKAGLAFGADAIRAIRRHSWPGNVRELQNRVRRAVIMCEARRISPADLELEHTTAAPSGLSLKEARENLEREMLTSALRKHGGKVAPAAGELGISRPTMYELMGKLGIARGDAPPE